MKDLTARLIAWVFVGSFCVVGPLLLLVGLGAAVQRAVLLYSGLRAEGTVIAKRASGSGRVTYAPVFRFTASDGHTYVVNSDVSGRESAFRYGEHVDVIYRPGHPESARIDAFAELWIFPLVFGVVGAAFSIIPALVLSSWMRRRRMSAVETGSINRPQVVSDTASPGLRWTLGILLTGGGLALLAVGLGIVYSHASSPDQSRVVVTSLGVLLTASGVLVAQWVAPGSRLSHALGAAAITAMAWLFGWVALYGEASGFSGGISFGGASVASSGSATPARIAFGIGSLLLALTSLWAWKQVLRPRG